MNYINKIFLLSAIVVLFLSTKIFCDVNIETYLDKKDISIGDNINLTIKITSSGNSILISPEYDCIKDWYIKDIAIKRDKNNYNTYNINMVITTFKSDIKEIPGINFEFVDKDKNSSIVSTKPIEVNIINTLSDNIAEIDKLKNVKNVKKLEIRTIYSYIFLVFVFYFFVLLLFQIIRKKKEFKLLRINKIKKDMINNLDKLLSQDNNFETKYSQMSDTIMKFIKLEYNVEYNKFSSDVISEIEELDMPTITFRIISDILERVQSYKENKTEFTDTVVIKDINNLKFVISNSFEKKDSL